MTEAEKYSTLIEKIPQVYEAGKQDEYDWLWDNLQENGKRKYYNNAFGAMWNEETFKPKYDIRPESGYMMFFNNAGKYIVIDDFVEFCKERGIEFDISNCRTLQNGLANLRTKRYGTLDFSRCVTTTGTNSMFLYNIALETIEEIIFGETTVFHNNAFDGATSLANINKASGVLASSIIFKNCPLTLVSATNILNVLKNYAGTANEGSYGVTFSTTTQAYLDEAGTIFNGMDWRTYLASIGWVA